MLKIDRIMMESKMTKIDNGVNRPFNVTGGTTKSEKEIKM
jgi:hypothetical protein